MNLGVDVGTVEASPVYWIVTPFAASIISGGGGADAITVGTKGAKLYCDSNAVMLTSRLFAL